MRTPNKHTNVPQRLNTPPTVAITAREGQSAAARPMAQEDVTYLRTYCCWVCVHVRVGQTRPNQARPLNNIWRRTTLSRSPPEIGTKHPFLVDFPILEMVRTNVRLHLQCTHIFLWVDVGAIKILDLDRGTISSGLNPVLLLLRILSYINFKYFLPKTWVCEGLTRFNCF